MFFWYIRMLPQIDTPFLDNFMGMNILGETYFSIESQLIKSSSDVAPTKTIVCYTFVVPTILQQIIELQSAYNSFLGLNARTECGRKDEADRYAKNLQTPARWYSENYSHTSPFGLQAKDPAHRRL